MVSIEVIKANVCVWKTSLRSKESLSVELALRRRFMSRLGTYAGNCR